MKFLYYRLDWDRTRLFLANNAFGAAARQSLARYLVQRFCNGVYVAGANLEVLAFVNPVGVLELLKPPREKIARHECANNDTPEKCVCRTFLDPETRGPWSQRKVRAHHPLCGLGARSAENWHEVNARGLVLYDGAKWRELKLEENPPQ